MYGTAVKNGDKALFDTTVWLYEKEQPQEERVRLICALGGFSEPEMIRAALDYGFNSGKVRSGDFMYILSWMGSSANGRRAAWQFIKDNWEKVSERYSGSGLNMIKHIIGGACSGFAHASDADEIEQFFKEHPAPNATRAIAEALERIRVRAAWYERDKNRIASALSDLSR